MLLKNGITVAIITGRNSPLTARRARDLGIEHLIQGREDKKFALLELCDQLDIDPRQAAYLGDDLPDLGAIVTAGFGMSVANAHPFVSQHASYQTQRKGGDGAVREVCDLILEAKGLLADLHQAYLL